MDPDARPSFAALLKEFGVARGLSQDALAERAGLSQDAISLLERGLRLAPRRDTVSRIARALILTADERARLLAVASKHRHRGPHVSPGSGWSSRVAAAATDQFRRSRAGRSVRFGSCCVRSAW